MTRIVLSILFVFTWSCLISQNSGFGIRGGFNYSVSSIEKIFSGPDSSGVDTIKPTGISYGGFFEFKVNKGFYLQPEFRFSQKEISRGYLTGTNGDMRQTSLITNNFEIPVLAKLKIGPEILRLTVLAGPNFEFRTSQFEEISVLKDGVYEDVSKTDLAKDSYESFNYTNIAGFGLDIKVKNITIFMDYRYNFGIRKLDTVRKDGLLENLGANVGAGIIAHW